MRKTGQQISVRHADSSGDFPGSPVILTFAVGFTEAGRIASLTIRA